MDSEYIRRRDLIGYPITSECTRFGNVVFGVGVEEFQVDSRHELVMDGEMRFYFPSLYIYIAVRHVKWTFTSFREFECRTFAGL